jgi:predicted Zn finger-like uncharacterized protein
MFTVCSKCNLRLTVTATDLRAAQGYVRCGRCHNVFNALAALADEPGRPAEAITTADTQSRAALTPPEPTPPEPEPEPPAADSHADTDTSLEFNPASTNINEVFIEAAPGDRTGTFESIVLIGEEPAPLPIDAAVAPQALSAAAAPAPTEAGGTVDLHGMRDALAEPDRPLAAAPEPQPEAPMSAAAAATREVAEIVVAPVTEAPVTEAPVSVIEVPVAETPVGETLETEAPAAASAPETTLTADEPEVAATSVTDSPLAAAPEPETSVTEAAAAAAPLETAVAETDEAPFLDEAAADEIVSAMDAPGPLLAPERPAPRVPRWAVQGASAALVLCLIAQVAHHYRSELADTSLLRRPLTAVYQGLGQPLEIRWDITNYEIRQLGASTDGAAAGDLVVRASISNRATRVQPLPLLRVVMQDRFGNRVAARDLAPAEYLGRGAPQVSLMAAGQRVDVQVAFQDPGQTATGFEIDACMAGRDHSVTCANDPGAH